jgi:hypothetical protein
LHDESGCVDGGAGVGWWGLCYDVAEYWFVFGCGGCWGGVECVYGRVVGCGEGVGGSGYGVEWGWECFDFDVGVVCDWVDDDGGAGSGVWWVVAASGVDVF